MAEPSSQSPPPEVNGGSAGGSRRADGGGGGGGAREQSLDLLPHGDRPTLLQLMSDPDYQQTQLGAAFKPSKQLKKGRFWCLVASHMQKPLPSVMLTGMHLRAEADVEWKKLRQKHKRQLKQSAAPLLAAETHAASGAAAAASAAALVQVAPVPATAAAAADVDVAAVPVTAAATAAVVEVAAVPAAAATAAVVEVAAALPPSGAAAAGAAAVQAEPEQHARPFNLLDLPNDVLTEIVRRIPLDYRWWILSSVHTRLRTLVRQLGLGDSCLCFDVTAAQKEHTSQFLLDVGKSLASAPPSQQLSALIQRLPLDEQLSVVKQLATDAQLRLVIWEVKQDMRHRLWRLNARPTLRKLALVSTEWLPPCLRLLGQLQSLTWDGEGPFEDTENEWGNALDALHQLTYLRWHPRAPPGYTGRRWDRWRQASTAQAALASMPRLNTLVWLPPQTEGALPDGAWLGSLRHIALVGSLAGRSVEQLQQAVLLETLCLTDWPGDSVQPIVSLVRELLSLKRFAYSRVPAAHAAAVAAAVAALREHRPELRIEDSSAACLAEMEGRN